MGDTSTLYGILHGCMDGVLERQEDQQFRAAFRTAEKHQ